MFLLFTVTSTASNIESISKEIFGYEKLALLLHSLNDPILKPTDYTVSGKFFPGVQLYIPTYLLKFVDKVYFDNFSESRHLLNYNSTITINNFLNEVNFYLPTLDFNYIHYDKSYENNKEIFFERVKLKVDDFSYEMKTFSHPNSRKHIMLATNYGIGKILFLPDISFAKMLTVSYNQVNTLENYSQKMLQWLNKNDLNLETKIEICTNNMTNLTNVDKNIIHCLDTGIVYDMKYLEKLFYDQVYDDGCTFVILIKQDIKEMNSIFLKNKFGISTSNTKYEPTNIFIRPFHFLYGSDNYANIKTTTIESIVELYNKKINQLFSPPSTGVPSGVTKGITTNEPNKFLNNFLISNMFDLNPFNAFTGEKKEDIEENKKKYLDMKINSNSNITMFKYPIYPYSKNYSDLEAYKAIGSYISLTTELDITRISQLLYCVYYSKIELFNFIICKYFNQFIIDQKQNVFAFRLFYNNTWNEIYVDKIPFIRSSSADFDMLIIHMSLAICKLYNNKVNKSKKSQELKSFFKENLNNIKTRDIIQMLYGSRNILREINNSYSNKGMCLVLNDEHSNDEVASFDYCTFGKFTKSYSSDAIYVWFPDLQVKDNNISLLYGMQHVLMENNYSTHKQRFIDFFPVFLPFYFIEKRKRSENFKYSLKLWLLNDDVRNSNNTSNTHNASNLECIAYNFNGTLNDLAALMKSDRFNFENMYHLFSQDIDNDLELELTKNQIILLFIKKKLTSSFQQSNNTLDEIGIRVFYDESQNKILKPNHHRVIQGNSLAELARLYYDDEERRKLLYLVNKDKIGINPDKLDSFIDLFIPQNDDLINYTVVENDSIYKIAKIFLGSEHKWPEIYENNPDIFIGEILRTGTVLKIKIKLESSL